MELAHNAYSFSILAAAFRASAGRELARKNKQQYGSLSDTLTCKNNSTTRKEWLAATEDERRRLTTNLSGDHQVLLADTAQLVVADIHHFGLAVHETPE